MKSNITKKLVLVLALSMLASCGGKTPNDSSSVAIDTTGGVQQDSQSTEDSTKYSSINSEDSTFTGDPTLSDYYYKGDYYNGIDKTLSKAQLVSKLHSLTSANCVEYDGLWEAYKKTDAKENGKVWDMYSDYEYTFGTDQGLQYVVEGTTYNREHAIPQSWFNSHTPMYSDLFNVYPTDGKVNGMRSNYPYGEVQTATYTSKNGSKLGNSISSNGYSGIVFEPIDEYKGDFARSYFYFAIRYYNTMNDWDFSKEAQYVFKKDGFYLTDYAVKLFLKWNELDPVSEKEIKRNNEVQKIQNNRNPFIDHPEFAEYIYGNGWKTVEEPIERSNESLANEAMRKINMIGNVTIDSKKEIDLARTMYDSLNSTQKALVTNYQTLVDAENKYNQIVESLNDSTICEFNTIFTSPSTINGIVWEGSLNGEQIDADRGNQFLQKNFTTDPLTFTTKSYTKDINSITVMCSNNKNVNLNVSVFVGDTQLGTTQSLGKINNKELVFSTNTPLNGEVKVVIKAASDATGSFYLKRIIIK